MNVVFMHGKNHANPSIFTKNKSLWIFFTFLIDTAPYVLL